MRNLIAATAMPLVFAVANTLAVPAAAYDCKNTVETYLNGAIDHLVVMGKIKALGNVANDYASDWSTQNDNGETTIPITTAIGYLKVIADQVEQFHAATEIQGDKALDAVKCLMREVR